MAIGELERTIMVNQKLTRRDAVGYAKGSLERSYDIARNHE